MKRFALVIGLVACVAGGAWAADVAVDRAHAGSSVAEAPGYDNTSELSWDSGIGRWWLVWYTGADSWVGNDFDVSTIKTYGGLKTMRIQLRYDWPNVGWEGGRIAVFSFAGGVPGSIMWPTSGNPQFVMPTGATGWKDFAVTWVLPGAKKFLAGWEQFYNWPPGADPFMIDNNPTFMGHSWQYMRGAWAPFEQSNIAPYRNVMLRMVVDNEQNPAVSPSSIGRVKALYF
jgi:hypothetical protein